MKFTWYDISSTSSIVDVGDIRLHTAYNKSEKQYCLYLSVKVHSDNGCKFDKICQEQRVASFYTKSFNSAKDYAESWFKKFVKDLVRNADMGISDLL